MAEKQQVPEADQVVIQSQALTDALAKFAEIIDEIERFPGTALAQAGILYADLAVYAVREAAAQRMILMPLYKAMPKPQAFPFGQGWQPDNPRADLLKAAAMILAEVHKMDAAMMGGGGTQPAAP